jgi:hypothetical protein
MPLLAAVLEAQILAVAVLVAVLVLQQQVRVVLALLLFLHPKRRHLPQVLQQSQLAAVERSTPLRLQVQSHSEAQHDYPKSPERII